MTRVSRNVSIAFILTLLYSILRYNIFGNVPVADIPTLIVNKAIAFSTTIILLFAFLNRAYKKADDSCSYMDVFTVFAIIHILISVSLLSQNYYPKLFANAKLTLFGNVAVLAGILSFTCAINKSRRVGGLPLYSLISAHLFFIGVKGWFDIEKWNGMLPPITLFCFVILIALVVLAGLHREPASARNGQ